MKNLNEMTDKELKNLEDEIYFEWIKRRNMLKQNHQCCECDFSSESQDEVYKHLMENHGYASEDASLGIKSFFIK